MNAAKADFNRMTDALRGLCNEGAVYFIAPSEPFEESSFEGDMEKLGDLYWLRFNDAKG